MPQAFDKKGARQSLKNARLAPLTLQPALTLDQLMGCHQQAGLSSRGLGLITLTQLGAMGLTAHQLTRNVIRLPPVPRNTCMWGRD